MNVAALPVLVLIVATLFAVSAGARTWRVERNGMGDFTVIQAAVDAAASGDTITIGPGRFDESQHVTCQDWSEDVRVLVTQWDLTIIGSGQETIIGPERPWDLSQGEPKGIVAGNRWGNGNLVVRDLQIENLGAAVYKVPEASI
jgi:hypothetical protein